MESSARVRIVVVVAGRLSKDGSVVCALSGRLRTDAFNLGRLVYDSEYSKWFGVIVMGRVLYCYCVDDAVDGLSASSDAARIYLANKFEISRIAGVEGM